jgi:hypothetical protein
MIGISESMSRRSALNKFVSVGIGSVIAGAGIASVNERARADDIPDVVLQWIGAWSSDNGPQEIPTLYGPDGSYADISAGQNVRGADIESFLQAMFASVNGFQRYMRQAFAVDGYVFADQLLTAIAPNGYDKMFEVYALTMFEVNETSILYSADYYDSGSILMQLGSIPAAPWFTAPNTPGAVGRFCEKSG